MKVIPLGVNGYIPSYNRQTSSVLVLAEKEAIVLDAGTGLGRLMEKPIADLLKGYESLNIILSHYHYDHIIGLFYLPELWRRGKICLYAPGEPFVHTSPDRTLNSFLQPPFFNYSFQDFPVPVEIIPVSESEIFIGDVRVEVFPLVHPGGSMGIRVNHLAYITDTNINHHAQEHIGGVDLLMHDMWFTDAEAGDHPSGLVSHSSESAVGMLAQEVKAKNLMPIHLHPRRTDLDIEQMEGRLSKFGVNVLLPTEKAIHTL